MSLVPVNGHIIIEPIEHSEFMASMKSQYDEIGVVISLGEMAALPTKIKAGDKVYFDSWLAKKYPKQGGTAEEFVWLVKWEDVVAIEHVEPIPEQ